MTRRETPICRWPGETMRPVIFGWNNLAGDASEHGRSFSLEKKLRILLVEDDVNDTKLIASQLETSGFDVSLTRVQTETEFRHELEAALPDLILSDHGLPSFSGFTALEIVRDEHPALPFIFVSGSNDQGMVARMYDAGATDYVFKSDLHDLSPAVREALKQAPAPAMETRRGAPPAADVAFTRVRVCPSCLLARDERGATVDFLNYFRSHNEIVVLHELCDACYPVTRLN